MPVHPVELLCARTLQQAMMALAQHSAHYEAVADLARITRAPPPSTTGDFERRHAAVSAMSADEFERWREEEEQRNGGQQEVRADHMLAGSSRVSLLWLLGGRGCCTGLSAVARARGGWVGRLSAQFWSVGERGSGTSTSRRAEQRGHAIAGQRGRRRALAAEDDRAEAEKWDPSRYQYH
jgi:hypothetical protein